MVSNGRSTAAAAGSWRRPDRTSVGLSVLLTVALALGAVGMTVVTARTAYDTDWFTGDVSQTAGLPWHVGLLSTAGVVLWFAAAAVAGTAALALRRGPVARMLAGGAALSVLFGLDDQLLLHDDLIPRLTGIQDPVSFTVYGLALLAWLWTSRSVLGTGAAVVLLLPALAGFGGSNLFDVFGIPGELGEEGLKLAGLVFWFAFFARVAVVSLAPAQASAGAASSTASTSPAPTC